MRTRKRRCQEGELSRQFTLQTIRQEKRQDRRFRAAARVLYPPRAPYLRDGQPWSPEVQRRLQAARRRGGEGANRGTTRASKTSLSLCGGPAAAAVHLAVGVP